MGRNEEQDVRWCALKVRVDCPECGSALFIDGPYKRVRCGACGAHTSVSNLWPNLLERCLERGAGGRHFRASSFVWAGHHAPHVLYAANKGHPPLCTRCDGVLHEAEQALLTYGWPGNVRELQNAVERAAILCPDARVGPMALPTGPTLGGGDGGPPAALGKPVTLAELEEAHIRRVVASSKTLEAAAETLGIDSVTLWRRRKRYGI